MRFRSLIAAFAVLLAGTTLAFAGDPDVEARLRALEEANRKLAEQCAALLKNNAETRRQADDRYRELEKRYESLHSKIEKPAAPPSASPEAASAEGKPHAPEAPEPPEPNPEGGKPEVEAREAVESAVAGERVFNRIPLKASFADGFELATPDDEFTLRFHSLSQIDFKDFIPNTQSPARSGLYIPRVRIYFEGNLTRLFDYEVSLQRSVEGVWDLLDANLDFNPSENFQIRFGRTLVPYSYDWYDHLEQYFITPERGLFPLNFGLSRSAGLLAQGWLFDRRVQFAVGGFDGRLTGVADNNNTRDAVGYLNARPFLKSAPDSPLRFLNVGGSVFVGQQIAPQSPLSMRTSIQSSENDEAAQNASAVFLKFNEDVSALGSRAAGALHLAWYYRSLSLESEWQIGEFDFARAGHPGRVGVPVSGYQVGAGYFLTGEQVEDRSTVIPLQPFQFGRGRYSPGAVEMFTRFSYIDLGEQVFTNELADANAWTRRVSMTDVGFNWYPNQFVKFYVDWQLPVYGSPVLTDPQTGRTTKTGNMFWVRCQVYF